MTIEDNEDAPTVTLVLTPASITENEGTSTVTATLSHPSNEATTIVVSASAGSGTAAEDFALSTENTDPDHRGRCDGEHRDGDGRPTVDNVFFDDTEDKSVIGVGFGGEHPRGASIRRRRPSSSPTTSRRPPR